MKKAVLKCLFATAATMAAFSASAAYPEKAVSIVVGYSPGGTTDILTRLLAEELSKELKQSVIVENRPGANENIGAAYVENARPDGHTLFLGTISQAINPILYKNAVDPIKAFEPVSMTASIPLVLIVNDKVAARDFPSFVELARQQGNALNYASSGNGSPGHLGAELFKTMSGTDAMHIPFKGGALANAAIVSGDIQFSFATMPGAAPLIDAGRIRALAVTTLERSARMPELPTIAEFPGFANFEANTWNAIFAPKGTPPAVIARLNEAIAAAMQSDKIKERFPREGAVPQASSPEALQRFLRQELDRWGDVVKQAKLQID